MEDQAERLREIVRRSTAAAGGEPAVPARARVIAVTSGKGGVGKTNLSINLSIALARQGKRVLLMDADLGLANVDVCLGIIPRYNLGHVLSGERELNEIIVEGPEGIRVIPSGSGGVRELAYIGESARSHFVEELTQLEGTADVLVVDTGAGMSRNTMSFILAAQEVVVITTPEPTSLMDAYGIIKVATREKPGQRMKLVVNMVRDLKDAREASNKIIILAKKFLGREVENLGYILWDKNMPRAVREQRALLVGYPSSNAASCINNIASKLSGNGDADGPERSGIAGFFSNLARSIKREKG
jgi:flagellar biosynthesis protein FlhG